jgi:hypothetical protein
MASRLTHGVRGSAAAIAEDDRRRAARRRRHRMAVDQKRAAEAVEQKRQLLLDRAVVRPVRLVKTLDQLKRGDRPSPQIAMLLRSRGDDPEPAARPRRHASAPRAVDHRRVDVVLGPVAIDRRPRSARDNRSAAALQRPPDQPVDERVLEAGEGPPPRRRALDEPLGIVAARVRDRQQHRKAAARFVDDRGGKRNHDEPSRQMLILCQFRTAGEGLQRMSVIFASGKTRFVRA